MNLTELINSIDFSNPVIIVISGICAIAILCIILKLIRKLVSKGIFLILAILGFGTSGTGILIELINSMGIDLEKFNIFH